MPRKRQRRPKHSLGDSQLTISTSRVIQDQFGQYWTILFGCQLPQGGEPEPWVVLE